MTGPTLYRIVDDHPYLSREDEYPGLTLDEAASRMDDLTGVGADVILADLDEDCAFCMGSPSTCVACGGTTRGNLPWKWTDEDTGREVTMRLEVEGR